MISCRQGEDHPRTWINTWLLTLIVLGPRIGLDRDPGPKLLTGMKSPSRGNLLKVLVTGEELFFFTVQSR